MAMEDGAADGQQRLKLRLYQHEILDESLQRNVIAAMPTGSESGLIKLGARRTDVDQMEYFIGGKTHIAIARIQVECERSNSNKVRMAVSPSAKCAMLTAMTQLVWFMAPNKALAEQQCRVLQTHLPAYHIRSLTGADDVDKWTTQELWDAFLYGVHVVVGTPAVLLDALTHAFVPLSRLSLLVFDEAHRCVKNDPMNRIMRDFYHVSSRKGLSTPHILGLSASPVMNSNASQRGLEVVESNLDATTVTPKQYRAELEAHVHPPELVKVDYDEHYPSETSPVLQTLAAEVAAYDIAQDPYVVELKAQDDHRRLLKVYDTDKTFCTEQLKNLLTRARHICEQLGTGFADWYIRTCVSRYTQSRDSTAVTIGDLETTERRHLERILLRVVSSVDSAEASTRKIENPSNKARSLLSILAKYLQSGLRSIIFVEQRAMVLALAHLLQCSELSNDYKVGTFVGTSTFAGRASSLVDLCDLKSQAQDLQDFRDGSKNLMIATNVLEEGIDVPACNCVICFDRPKNLISFVQRRGRARQADSRYILFVPRNDLQADPSRWQELENKMLEAYMDEQRAARSATDGAELEEDEEAVSNTKYTVDVTGALLTLENARGHLHHFCAIATKHHSRYIDPRPEFSATRDLVSKTWTASVTLPAFVHGSIRVAQSRRAWYREQTAIKDAALSAYIALHRAGLVNDNLLPAFKDCGPDPGKEHADQPSLINVSGQRSMWDVHSDPKAQENLVWHASQVTLFLSQREILSQVLWLPAPIASTERIQLHWNADVRYEVSITSIPHANLDAHGRSKAIAWTALVLRSVFADSMAAEDQNLACLLSPPTDKTVADMSGCLSGHDTICDYLTQAKDRASCGIVHVTGQHGRAFILDDICEPTLDSQNPEGFQEAQLVVTSFPKRRTFLRAPESDQSGTAYTKRLQFPVSQCTIERLPMKYSIFAVLLPSILHQIDITSVAHQLNTSTVRPVQMSSITTILEASSAPAAKEQVGDYNRLEYLGDSILKFYTEFQLLAQHATWPEAFLSAEKDRIVRNSNLAKVALEAGLDQFVLAESFTGKKWRPPYLYDASGKTAKLQREISSKVLADVVEALIGAAYVDGGLAKAYACIRTLLPKETWWDSDVLLSTVLKEVPSTDTANFAILAKLIGHSFSHRGLLLEAVTHASYPNNRVSHSYERLEFFGDAVLDLIITPKLYAHALKLRHWDLHRIHEALVNGHFLGYCCMALRGEGQVYDIVKANTNRSNGPGLTPQSNKRTVYLHDFIRASSQLLNAKRDSISKFGTLSKRIETSLSFGELYPWPDLIALAPEKFLSDIVESILGAIYLDTRGDTSACEAFLQKLGILPTMRSILDREMETTLPKERVGILADSKEVRYVVQQPDVEMGRTGWGCTVVVGGAEVSSVSECASREEAEVRAADIAASELAVQTGEGRRTRRKLNV